MMAVFFISALLLVFSILIIGRNSVDAFVLPPSSSAPAGIHHGTLHSGSSSSALLAATLKKDHDSDDEEEAPRHVPSEAITNDARAKTQQGNQVGVGRRGTLMTLLGGAMSFAASDALLGAAGGVLNGGKAALTSSGIYAARWNALYQRLAAYTAKHEAAVASPELLAWISKSPAAIANPELRAWMAAQGAFSKSRQVLRASAVLEEGLAAFGAAAVAVAAKQEVDAQNKSDNVLETTVASTATPLEATSSESELSSSPMNLAEANEKTATPTSTLKNSSMMISEDGTENDRKEV